MDWNGLVRVHIEQGGANDVYHLLPAGRVDSHLQMPDLDTEITTKTRLNK